MNSHRKNLILTGASRGIGHATVQRFSLEGWRVITVSRFPVPEDCPWEGGAADHVQIDLSDPAILKLGVELLRERLQHAPLHALVNNAGVSPKGPGGERLGVMATSQELWQQVFQINFFAPVMLARGLIEELRSAHGAVVNVTSFAGSRVHRFAGAAYAASKAALAALTREMAAEFGPSGVRVNAIAPGEIQTAMLSPATAELIPQIPLGRLGLPEEVARVIYLLCSEQTSYINGSEIYVDGGQRC